MQLIRYFTVPNLQKREIKIQQITKGTMDSIDDNIVSVDSHPILFIVDKDKVSKVRY